MKNTFLFIHYIFRDIETGSTCSLDPQTNLPDENCVFIPIGDNSAFKSSYMAAPFLESVDHFCKNTEVEYHHDIYKPTKHNSMCDYKSTWDVIMENEDFINVNPMNITNNPPETEFTILYPDDGGRFVLVLDRSGSMDDESRMDRLKQSSTRWIEYDVTNGTQIGLASFSSAASKDKDLTKVDDNNRQDFVKVINDLKPNGGTCLGLGLMKGMDVSIILCIVFKLQ
jgi:calcium-activated chloride channel regulator 4